MTSFVLRTEDDEDLGFLLFADHEGDWPPAGENDCIFTGFPVNPALLDDPRGRFIAEQKNNEWVADISYTDTEMTLRIVMGPGAVFDLTSNANGNSWMAVHEGETLRGTGQFL